MNSNKDTSIFELSISEINDLPNSFRKEILKESKDLVHFQIMEIFRETDKLLTIKEIHNALVKNYKCDRSIANIRGVMERLYENTSSFYRSKSYPGAPLYYYYLRPI